LVIGLFSGAWELGPWNFLWVGFDAIKVNGTAVLVVFEMADDPRSGGSLLISPLRGKERCS
jgi:hypothetical protein